MPNISAQDFASYNWLLGPMMGVIITVGLIVYIYQAIALYVIAQKTNTANPWLAWIPIANIYLMTQIAGVPWWTLLVILLAFIPVIGPLAILAVMIWWWWKISEKRNQPGWMGILMAISPINLVVIGILAWYDKPLTK